MTDLEMIRLCAEAMQDESLTAMEFLQEGNRGGYEPLIDDAQAMALVKKFRLYIEGNFYETGDPNSWHVHADDDSIHDCGINTDLNRAIVECVAKMQKTRETA